MRVVPDPQPDEQVEAAGDDAHVLGLGQRRDGLDDLAQVHSGPGGDGQVDHDREAERGPVDVHPVAADHPAALEPGQPSATAGGEFDLPGQRPLGLAGVGGQGAQQRQIGSSTSALGVDGEATSDSLAKGAEIDAICQVTRRES